MICSRCRRLPEARARSFMRLAAFLRRQASSWMVRAPTMTSKPPSNLMRTASGFLPLSLVGLCIGLLLVVMLLGGCPPLCVPFHALSLHLCLKGKTKNPLCTRGSRLAHWLLTPLTLVLHLLLRDVLPSLYLLFY